MVNDTTRLLGLDGLVADRVELHPDGSPVVHLSTGDEQARCCPQCGLRAVRVKQWTTTRPRDLPIAGRTARLRWRKQRWHCDQLGCPPARRSPNRYRSSRHGPGSPPGCVIKTVARDAYGFRNPENQRLRTRTATTRSHRGHLNPANFEEPAIRARSSR